MTDLDEDRQDWLTRKLNDPNDPALRVAHAYMDSCEKKYQDENPCPKCGSHNTHFDVMYISGPHSGWIEYCDDCDWKKETKS